MLLGDAVAPESKAFAAGVGLGNFALVVPAAALDQVVHVGAVRAFGIAVHAQCGDFQGAAVFFLVGQRVLADPVLLQRLVGGGGHIGSVGQQLDLQRQQVAEDAREGDDHVDARAAQFFQRNQRGTGNAAIAVKARACAHEGQHLADGRAFVFQVVRAPQHHGNRLGQGVAVCDVAIDQALGLAGSVAQSVGAGDLERIKAVHIAPGRQHVAGLQDVAARGGRDKATFQGAQQAFDFVVGGHLEVAVHQFSNHGQRGLVARQFAFGNHRCHIVTGHDGGQCGIAELGFKGGAGHGFEHLAAGGSVGRAAGHVQAAGDQGVFQLQQLIRELFHARLQGGVNGPVALGFAQIQNLRLGLDLGNQFQGFGRQGIGSGLFCCAQRRQAVPALQRHFQVIQTFVQTGIGHRRREVAHQRRARAALGDSAFGRVVAGVEVDVGQIVNQAVGPAGTGHAALLAGHEFECAMGAEMQHCVGSKVFADVAVKSRERMGR